MADLTKGEQILFAKYWGRGDLMDNDGFWEDVFKYYSEAHVDLPLPIAYDPCKLRQLMEMFECPVGECGKCCRYPKVHVSVNDIDRIARHTDYTVTDIQAMCKSNERGLYLPCEGGCPFLKDNVCTIYDYRPDTCWLFPFQGPRQITLDGKPFNQVLIRIMCRPALKVAKTIIKSVFDRGDRLLLPDLSIIPVYKEEHETSNSDAVKAKDGGAN